MLMSAFIDVSLSVCSG